MQDPTTPSESARATERWTKVTEDLVHQMGHGSITEFECQAVDRCLGMSLSVVLWRGTAPRRRRVNIEGGKRAYKGSAGMSFLCFILSHSQLKSSETPGSPGHRSSSIFPSRYHIAETATMKSLMTAAVLSWAVFAQHAFARRLDWEGEPLPTPRSVFVTWESSLNTGKQIIFVADSEGSSLLTYACDSKVNLGGVPIQVKADETGNGEITIGKKHYAIDFDARKSGGVACEARWNDDVAVVECEVPWTAGGLDSLSTLSPNVTAECLGREADNDLAMVSVFTEQELVVFPPIDEEDEQTDADRLVARQCYDQAPVIKKKGNGNPHKWRRHKQVTVRGILSLHFHVNNLPP